MNELKREGKRKRKKTREERGDSKGTTPVLCVKGQGHLLGARRRRGKSGKEEEKEGKKKNQFGSGLAIIFVIFSFSLFAFSRPKVACEVGVIAALTRWKSLDNSRRFLEKPF